MRPVFAPLSLNAGVESIMQPGVKYLSATTVLALALMLSGCSSKPPETQTPEPPKATVSTPIVKDDEIDTEVYSGSLVAGETVEVRSRLRGLVKTIYFKDPPKGKAGEGELVKKGELLFELDPKDFQEQIVLSQQ